MTLVVDPPRIARFPLDSDPGWSREGEWAFGTPAGQGGGGPKFHPDPRAGATGKNVFGVNLDSDYSTTPGGPFYLTTGAIDLTNYEDTRVRFQRWLNSAQRVNVVVKVSPDGKAWTQVFDNVIAEVADDSWRMVEYDISAVADGQSTVFIRWGYRVQPNAAPASGWNIDDVEILGVPRQKKPPYRPVPARE